MSAVSRPDTLVASLGPLSLDTGMCAGHRLGMGGVLGMPAVSPWLSCRQAGVPPHPQPHWVLWRYGQFTYLFIISINYGVNINVYGMFTEVSYVDCLSQFIIKGFSKFVKAHPTFL